MRADRVRSGRSRRRVPAVFVLALLVLAVGLTALLRPGEGTSASPSPAVTGLVVVSSGCPVLRPGHPCPAQPVSGAQVSLWREGHVVTTGRSDEHGRFRLFAPAGPGELRAQTSLGGYVARASSVVTLSTGSTDDVRLALDNGVR